VAYVPTTARSDSEWLAAPLDDVDEVARRCSFVAVVSVARAQRVQECLRVALRDPLARPAKVEQFRPVLVDLTLAWSGGATCRSTFSRGQLCLRV
jgi:hypothetical protein